MNTTLNETEEVKPTSTLDVEGLSCPLPLLLIKKKLARLSLGDILQINGILTSFVADFEGWCERRGHVFLGEKELHGKTVFFVKNG